jgi:hypothetical protein
MIEKTTKKLRFIAWESEGCHSQGVMFLFFQ